jgi:hypothetical protein
VSETQAPPRHVIDQERDRTETLSMPQRSPLPGDTAHRHDTAHRDETEPQKGVEAAMAAKARGR